MTFVSLRCVLTGWWFASVVVAAIAVTSTPQLVWAQRAASDADEARRLFEEADRAIDEDRLADARDLLQRSIALVPRASAAFNLAMVSRSMGENRVAADLLQRLLNGELGALPSSKRAEVAAMLETIAAHLASVDVGVRSGSAELRVDGERLAELTVGHREVLRLDAGRHVVSVRSEDGRVQEREVELAEGDAEHVDFDFASMPTNDRDPSMEANESDDGGALASPWLWVGVVVAVVAAGVVVAVLAWPRDPEGDPIWGTAQPLVRF